MSANLEPRTTRRLTTVLSAGSGLVFGALVVLGRPIFGVGVYVLGVLGTIGVRARSDAVLYDERDRTHSREAAGLTLRVFGYASGVVFPALTVAWAVGRFDWPAWSVAVACTVAAVYLTYGGLRAAISARS